MDARPTQQQLAAEAAAKQQALDAKAAAEQQAQQLQQQLAAETAAKQQTLADKVTAEKRATDAEAAQQQAEQEKANAEKHNIRVSAEVTKVLKQIEMERDEHTVNLWKDKINTIAEYSKADEMPTAAKDYLTRRQNEYRVQLNKASARLEKTKAEYLQLARKKPAKWESFKNLCLYYSSKKDPFDLEPLKQELKKGDATQLKATLLHVDEKNRNLLHFAAGWGHKKSDQLYNLELSNWTSYWPICGSSLVETPVSVLTEKAKELGIDLSGYVDQQDAFGNTPLHYAIMAKSFDTISDFEGIASAEKVSIGWDAKNKEGKSPSGLIIDNETNPDSESFYDPSIPLSTIAINQLSDKNIQETIIKKLADKLSPETIKMLSQQTQQAIIQARENKFEPVGSFTGIAVSLRNALRKQTIKGIVRTTMQSTGKKAKDILTPLLLEIKNIIINIYKDPNIYIDRDSYLKTMESLSEHYKQTQPTTTSSSSSKPLQWEAIKSACLSENLAGIDLTNKNIDFLMYTDGNGRNLLHFAAGGRRQEWQEGYVSIDNLYDINLCNKKPVTFWFYPMVDNTPIRRTPVNILIKKAQDLNLDINTYVNKQDALHNTPLHYAIMAKHMSTILDLQNSKQVRWDIKNNNDETPEDLFINNEKSSYAHSFYDPQRFTTYTNINKFMEAEVQGKVITSIYEKFTNLTKKALSSRIQNAITQAFNKQFKSDLHFGDIREALINILRVQILTEEEKKLPAQEIVTLPQDVQAVIKQAQQQPTSIIDRALYIKARKAMLQLSKLHQKTSQSSSSNT